MKTLTVFTPTYNRGYILHNCYEALLRQTSNDFKWLIIDDGSTDNTETIVKQWIEENRIDIQYIKQENQGMHGAHNTAHKNADTLLTVCCDSDDFFSDRAVEIIINLWKEKSSDKHAGIIGHDADLNGNRLVEIPSYLKETTLYDLRYKLKLRGDFKLIYRTDLLQEETYPLIKGEKYLAVGYKYFLLDQKYSLIVTNETLCFVDYQNDGGTINKTKKYVESPKGFMHYRIKMMPIMHNYFQKYWQAIHYINSAIFAKDSNFIQKSPCKITTILAIPFGFVLNQYIRYKYRNKYLQKD
ncbi:glycosyltransferase family 2 protein [Salinicoccus roseus]|uniref:glycosyltransferase family 2 protein n=1 Tax=Salinicoccus roseus TaxID=45670 RepID=UPI0023016E31|nr:glycosyltransferase family 2 protein [Salinicoccus roseus]